MSEIAAAEFARWHAYADRLRRPQACVFCGERRVWWNGRPTRTASVVREGEMVHITGIVCRRVKCARCRRSWRLRPPGLVAHKHYQLCVVAHAASSYLWDERSTLTSVASAHGCARRTVKRWLSWLAAMAHPAALLAAVSDAAGAPLVPKPLAVAQLGRKARCALSRCLLERAAEVMGLFEALGSAQGLEPPGLRAVLERVLAHRVGVATYARPTIPELARGQPP